MKFVKINITEKIGKFIGFIGMFLIFAIILYFILLLLGNLPKNSEYFFAIQITLAITLIGTLFRMVLK